MKKGVYDFEGNMAIYEGGEEFYDVDSAEYYPVDLLAAIGEYERPLDEDEKGLY